MARPVETPFGPMGAVADWLRANDIDPSDVPIEGPIAVEQGHIRYTAHLRNEDGHKYVDQTTGDVAQEDRTTLLKVEPPANVRVRAADRTPPARTELSAEDIARWLRDPANREAVTFVLRREARVDPTWLISMLREEARRQGGWRDWVRQ